MPRKLPNFIDNFIEYTEGKGSPRPWRLWSAIFMIGAAVERKRWIITSLGKTYPNNYILLVGPAGTGKSLCTHLAYELLNAARSEMHPLHIAPTSVTKASLVDALSSAERTVVRPMEIPATVRFNSLVAIVNEFGVFLPAWDGEFMSFLTDVWDHKRYAETRRTGGLNTAIPDPQLNILSASTPAHLTNLLPEGAWEQGFMSRMINIYCGETIYTDLFAKRKDDSDLRGALVHDLKEIHESWGEMDFTEEAQEVIGQWAIQGGEPAPTHPKLFSYRTRRTHHLLKLCMIASLAEDNEGIITAEHFKIALGWLMQAEGQMTEIFKSMAAGGDGQKITDCWHHCCQLWLKNGKEPIPATVIWEFLQARAPAHSVRPMIAIMEKSGLLVAQHMPNGQPGYKPRIGKG